MTPARLRILSLILPLFFAGSLPAQSPEPCAGVNSCIATLVASARQVEPADSPVVETLLRAGDPAVQALLPLLSHEQRDVRMAAAYVLSRFDRLHARNLPALIAGYELVRPGERGRIGRLARAIGAVGSDEAMAYLQSQFLTDPDPGGSVASALSRFGDRLRPFVLEQLGFCARDPIARRCNAMLALFDRDRRKIPNWVGMAARPYAERQLAHCQSEFNEGSCSSLVAHLSNIETFPDWAEPGIAALARVGSNRAREVATDVLSRARRPVGLDLLMTRLRDQLATAEARDRDISRTVSLIGRYGEATAPHAEDLAAVLARHDLDGSRVTAALLLGQTARPDIASRLIALEPYFADDFLLAYNSVESLGRLRAIDARALLERQSRNHWHPAVRNNALRALNALEGRAFALDQPGDTEPFEISEDHWMLAAGWPRYAGDRALPRWCFRPSFENLRPAMNRGVVDWPNSRARYVDLTDDIQIADESLFPFAVRELIPEQFRSAEITAVLRSGRYWLVGINMGEWGGGLFRIAPGTETLPVVRANVVGTISLAGSIVVITGLSHGVSSHGKLILLDPDDLLVRRRIRLPAEPRNIALTDRRAIVFETMAGDLALGEDGNLLDPGTLNYCRSNERAS